MRIRTPKLLRALGLTLCTSVFSSLAYAENDLFISEYVEGSSYNKAIEIFNDTGSTVDLSTYQLQFFFNGNDTAGRTITLQGTLDSGDVFVIAQDRAENALRDLADQTDTSTSWFNGDDAVVLLHNDTIIDVIGQVGTDPGSEWGTGDTSTKDNTIRRTICEADNNTTDAFDPANQWAGYPTNTFDNIGIHTCDAVEPPPTNIQSVFIHDIQGSGDVSPMVGQTVEVEAIVVADFQSSDTLNGFFLQEEDADADNSDLTSEGIFVYEGYSDVDVSVGDRVKVTGVVAEYYDLTELKDVTVEVIENAVSLPTASEITLPFTSTADMERYEGMSVSFSQELTVTETYNLGRYGQFWLSSNGRLQIPTNVVSPGTEAIEMGAANDLNRILVDDFSSDENPDPIIYPQPELTADNTLRIGTTVQNLQGVVYYSYGDYQIQPTQPLELESKNPRTASPDEVGGSLKVASFNVLNYFNGDGIGGGFPTSRGADSYEEFERQRTKIIAAISSMNADIIGLMEIENDGYSENSAIADLVKGLNDASLDGSSYAFINPGVSQIGTDEIAVGLIYRTNTVKPVGSSAILDSSVDPEFIDTKNRPALAQTFEEIASNGIMTVAVNHLKSKGSDCDDLGDPDTGDGQGNCNLTRTKAAEALVNWLSKDPTNSQDTDFMIIGDLNSYAMEDPISAIKSAGYSDLIMDLGTEQGYSYVFDGESGYLDHALSSSTLTGQVSGVTEWHINADEPRSLDYNVEYKSDNQIISLYSPEAYRASDHDPVVIGLNLMPSPKYLGVADLKAWFEMKKGKQHFGSKLAKVEVTVVNDFGEKVENVNVEGLWKIKKRVQEAACMTDEKGQCTVVLETKHGFSPVVFSVKSLSHERLEYDSSLNEETHIRVKVFPRWNKHPNEHAHHVK